MSLKSLDKLLNCKDGAGLDALVRRARTMDSLAAALRARFDPGGNRIVAANVRDDGELVVICSSSAWASRLRFESESLLAATRAAGFEVRRCRIRVGAG